MKNTLKLTLATVLGLASVVAFAVDEPKAVENKDIKIKVAQYQRDLFAKEQIDLANKAYEAATKVEKDAKLDPKVQEDAAKTLKDAKTTWSKGGEEYKKKTEEFAKAQGLEAKDIADTCTFSADAKSALWGTNTRKACTVVAAAGIAGLGYYAYTANQANQAAE